MIQISQNSIALVGLLFSFNWLLVLIWFLVALPGAFARLLHSRRLYGFEQAQTEKERRAWHYHNILTDALHAQELRFFNLGVLFQTRYRDLRQQIRDRRLGMLYAVRR